MSCDYFYVRNCLEGSAVDSRQISPKVGLMLQILDLVSLARLAGYNHAIHSFNTVIIIKVFILKTTVNKLLLLLLRLPQQSNDPQGQTN